MKVDLSCPIELWEYALPTADSPAISFTFFNLGERTISSIQITVMCFDEKDQVLSRRVERPMALDAKGREPFMVTLDSDGQPVEAVDLTIDKAWYEDGREWRRQQDVRLVDYEPNELPPNRKLEQLRYVAGSDAVGFPSDQGNVWICVCGRVNAKEADKCARCDRDRDEVFERFSPDAVQEAIDERERELEEKARMAREEASRQEFIRQDKARRKRRARRTRTIIISAVVAVAVLSYLFVVLGLPELRYQSAMAALNEGSYTVARDGFEALGTYRDAADMVVESDLRQAQEYIKSEDVQRINTAISILQSIQGREGVDEMINEANYQKGLVYLSGEAYDMASLTLKALGAYRDADTLYRESEYQRAMQDMDDKAYEAAARRFQSLGNYQDAADMASECIYRPAMEMLTAKDYGGAVEMFSMITGYKDAGEQRLDALYKDALQAQLAGDHEYAAERFTMLGDYEDAPEQVTHSIYLAANTARDSGNYEIAMRLYTTIPEYQDAAEQVKACTYLPAKVYMSEGRYDEAAALFEQIPGYLDADDLYSQCLYLPAKAAAEAEDYDEAIRLYRQIPEYSDVPRLLMQAQYRQAEQLEADGDLEGAADIFAGLGEYSDAADRNNAALYALAEKAFEDGHYADAASQFEALGRFSDAQTRVKECQYAMALLLVDSGELAQAYEAMAAIDAYDPAREKAREIAYSLGEALSREGDLEGAAEAFENAGRYEDAAERSQDSVYQLAERMLGDGDYQRAGDLFDSIRDYTDARQRRDESYDLWLSEKTEEATALHDAEDFQGVIDLLKDLDLESLPRAYAGIATLYRDANLKIARQLIAEDRALEAYGYLIACRGYRNADTLLDKNIYRILGTWETEDGTVYAFYLNGTANLAGEMFYFNMLTSNPYGIFIGKTDNRESMERRLSYSSGSERILRLRDEETEETIVLSRVKAPEISATSDSGSAPVLAEEDLERHTTPVVDVVDVGEEIDLLDRDTPAPQGDDVPDEEEEGEETPGTG